MFNNQDATQACCDVIDPDPRLNPAKGLCAKLSDFFCRRIREYVTSL